MRTIYKKKKGKENELHPKHQNFTKVDITLMPLRVCFSILKKKRLLEREKASFL